MILSACQTAKGDEKTTLGTASITVRAGTSATMATLWPVLEDSTTELMSQFYSQLTTLGKAEALRQAQLNFINDTELNRPYFWAGFILLGNWL